MSHYVVEPEVAGALGSRTIMDRSIHPPDVERLHYQFEGWLGDVLLESFPVFIVTEAAKKVLESGQITGATFSEVEVTKTDQFNVLYPNRALPVFAWLKPNGKAGADDFGTMPDGRLVISQRVIDLLGAAGLSHALIAPFKE